MKDPHTRTDIPRLALAKTAGTDDRLDFLRFCCCQRSYIRIFRIKILYDYIDSRIRTLGCQSHTHKKLPRLVIIQCASRIRVFLLKSVDHFQSQFFFGHSALLRWYRKYGLQHRQVPGRCMHGRSVHGPDVLHRSVHPDALCGDVPVLPVLR